MGLDLQRGEWECQPMDDTLRTKFTYLPDVLASWTEPVGGLRGKRILDFGCGSGMTALGIALNHGAELVAGSDINREYEQCAANAREAGLGDLPANLDFETIERGSISRHDEFDFIYSWSVFEHVDQQLFDGVIDSLRENLRSNGHFFVQIAPLYYSPEGSHLWEIGFQQWEHLIWQVDHIYREIHTRLEPERAANLWSMYITLNKVTAEKLVSTIIKRGFELAREYRTTVSVEPPSDLLSAYTKDALITNQVVALFRKQ
jgi:cyclopropane fatty-acyl-phospholipid synthase-like methyltransferase